MLVWTLQPKVVYEEIKSKGYFITNPIYSEYNYRYYGYKGDKIFKVAYDFLIEEMKKKIDKPKGYKNLKLPIWSYYKVNGEHKRINMRLDGKYQRKPYVLFELDIPENEILLLDSDEWICILNNLPSYFCHSEYEYKCIDNYYESLNDKDKESFKYNSWRSNLFDLNTYSNDEFEDGWEIKHDDIEGVFWILKKDYIRTVWIYNDNL